jgi:hypothetical protein
MKSNSWVTFFFSFCVAVSCLALSALADTNSNAAIRARPADIAAYNVDGAGIGILQIDTEISHYPGLHPGLVGKIQAEIDFTNEGLLNPSTQFYAYNAGTVPMPQWLIWLNDFHGTAVAGVMVGSGLDSGGNQTTGVGVAPGAKVNVGKMWTSQLNKNDPTWGTQALMQMSRLTGPADVFRVAILEDQSNAGAANGTGLFALAADYVSFARDVTVVIPSGNFASPANGVPFSRPADAFNGISVGATDATYLKVVDFSNSGTTTDGRRKPDVVAPGVGINMPFGGWENDDGRDASAAYAYNNAAQPNLANFMSPNINAAQDADQDYQTADGTSFSGPHVAGQVALLQQYGRANNFSIHPQTMKAVVVNSANKIDGVLEMNKTILAKSGADWLASPAYNNTLITLDDDMGAGQIDVWRSLKQYDAGQHGPGMIPDIGWDYHALGAQGNSYDYVFSNSIAKDTYVSATLDWRREVTFTDANGNGFYDPANDSLAAKAADILHLFLMPKASNNIADAIWSSISNADNLQHIFFKVPQLGDYKLRVLFQTDNASAETNYGLAWWTVTVPEPGTFGLLSLALCGVALFRRSRFNET